MISRVIANELEIGIAELNMRQNLFVERASGDTHVLVKTRNIIGDFEIKDLFQCPIQILTKGYAFEEGVQLSKSITAILDGLEQGAYVVGPTTFHVKTVTIENDSVPVAYGDDLFFSTNLNIFYYITQ